MQDDHSAQRPRMGRPPVQRPLCPQCGERSLKRARDRFCGKACSNSARAIPPAERFAQNVSAPQLSLPSTFDLWCIDWSSNFSGDGYPAFSLSHDRQVGAHRYAYAVARAADTGESVEDILSSGVHVGHACDRPACVQNTGVGTYHVRDRVFLRYGHLIGMDNRANTHDKIDKGRSGHPSGEDHPNAKITEAIVHDIDLMWAQGNSQSEIAALYGIPQAEVSRIIRRERWQHVPRAITGPIRPNPNSKVDDGLRKAIAEDRSRGMTQQEIALKYGVDQTTVSRALRRQ